MTKSLLNNYTRLFKLLIYQFSHIAKRPLRSYLSDATKRAGVISWPEISSKSTKWRIFLIVSASTSFMSTLPVFASIVPFALNMALNTADREASANLEARKVSPSLVVWNVENYKSKHISAFWFRSVFKYCLKKKICFKNQRNTTRLARHSLSNNTFFRLTLIILAITSTSHCKLLQSSLQN